MEGLGPGHRQAGQRQPVADRLARPQFFGLHAHAGAAALRRGDRPSLDGVAHLANIALATRQCLQWDPRQERFLDNAAANQLLHYEYRKPWKLD